MQQEKKVFPCVSGIKTSGTDKTVPSHTISRDNPVAVMKLYLTKKKVFWRTFSSGFSPNVPINFSTTPVDLPCNIFAPMYSIRDFKLKILHDDWFEIVSILSISLSFSKKNTICFHVSFCLFLNGYHVKRIFLKRGDMAVMATVTIRSFPIMPSCS